MSDAGKKKILIVDDQADVRTLIHYSLSPLGYDLYSADNGEEAIISYGKHHHDIVLLDIMMPGELDGCDVCRMLKQEANPPAIIFVSALCRNEDIKNGLEAGADAYITKPFSPMGLVREIHRLFHDI
ncbi:Response regulator receiver domain-containing protein [Mariprofundus ferrinatatus]|uniref:Response regulator receiver domain-containing protein n=1 Tax=Mariprofundus ferrinatatus TaxID=1921087 RepID=A0A2K8L5X3_9PROT|nr:response regulator [Mariprofundus ferrinatatus]ATX82718.1 Response regulator receiver domain-containing protein [Mariprofundus ferrinatatus]